MYESEPRLERVKRFAKIWWKSRADAGKSQEFMALSLGVSKKTIQNWEKGLSAPNLFQCSEWFRVLGLNPTHYHLEFLYPTVFGDATALNDDKNVEKMLISLIKNASSIEKKQLLYLMAGNHGSPWYVLLQLFTAHCHTTLQSRFIAARSILDNYEIEEQTKKLVNLDDVKPNIEFLKKAMVQCKKAAQDKQAGYSTILCDENDQACDKKIK